MVDLPLEHYFVYGGSVPSYFPVSSMIVAALFTAFLCGLHKWSHYFGRFGTTAALVTLVFVAFGLARWGGAAAARSEFQFQRESDYPAYPRVRLAFGNKKLTGRQSWGMSQRAIAGVSWHRVESSFFLYDRFRSSGY